MGSESWKGRTKNGYLLSEVASALQKAIRRADGRLAGWWAVEMHDSGYASYLWRRLFVISAEDVAGCVTQEVEALYRAWQLLQTTDKKKMAQGKPASGRLFAAKAAVLLAMSPKSRDMVHLAVLAHDGKMIGNAELEADLEAARKDPPKIPDYAFDCHTAKGRSMGRTRDQMIEQEYRALTPRQPGLFDDVAERYISEHGKGKS